MPSANQRGTSINNAFLDMILRTGKAYCENPEELATSLKGMCQGNIGKHENMAQNFHLTNE